MLDQICHNNVSRQLSSKDRKSAGARTKTPRGRRLRRLVLGGPRRVFLPEEQSPCEVCVPSWLGSHLSAAGWGGNRQWPEMLGHAVLSWAYRVPCSWDVASQKTWPSAPLQSRSIWPFPKRWHDLGGGQVPERLSWELSAYSQHPQHLWEWELQSRARRVVLETYRYFSLILWVTFLFFFSYTNLKFSFVFIHWLFTQ